MIDLHSHILPGLDDGAKEPELSIAMARSAEENGTTLMVATPHCSSGDKDLPGRIRVIRDYTVYFNRAMERLNRSIRFLPGMEILCDDALEDCLRQGNVIPLGESRCLLIEFMFSVLPAEIRRAAELLRRYDYTPVLAHPERYTCVQRKPALVSEWFRDGYVIQLDKGSILGRFGQPERRCAARILQQGLAHVVASDAHGIKTRTPELRSVQEHISLYYSPMYANVLLERNPRRLLDGLPVLQPGED